MKRVDHIVWTYDPILHGLIYDVNDNPYVGELRDVREHKEAGCNVAKIKSVTKVDYSEEERTEKTPFYWYIVLEPTAEIPCDEEFMKEISS